MKTPISYYGGKQTLATRILTLFPVHHLYCEPFLGGGAVFFRKEKSAVEVINDLDKRVVNFYRVCKDEFELLKYLIDRTPHSRAVHQESAIVMKNPEQYGPVWNAWAFWVQTNMSFGSAVCGGWAYARKKNSCEKKIKNKKIQFTEEVKERLDMTQIECNDAIKVISSRDTPSSFFYCDPPYYNADMGHYAGYTFEDFNNLLDRLSKIQGKFLLSSYPSDILKEYTKKHGWHTASIEKALSVTHQVKRNKTEVLTANYKIKL